MINLGPRSNNWRKIPWWHQNRFKTALLKAMILNWTWPTWIRWTNMTLLLTQHPLYIERALNKQSEILNTGQKWMSHIPKEKIKARICSVNLPPSYKSIVRRIMIYLFREMARKGRSRQCHQGTIMFKPMETMVLMSWSTEEKYKRRSTLKTLTMTW